VDVAGGVSNRFKRVLHAVDRFQQSHTPTAFLYGVVKKFGDDRGGQLAGLIAFYGFLSFFPLMIVVVTLTSFLAHGNAHLARQIRDSALNQFPVVGKDLAGSEQRLPGSGLGLALGLLGLVWGAMGVTQTVQYAFAEVWHVPYKARAGFLPRILRGLGLFVLLGLGIVATTVLASLGPILGDSLLAGAAGFVAGAVLSVALSLVVFLLMSPKTCRWTDLLPGAAVAGVGWQVLSLVGVQLVRHQLQHSSELYGTAGVVLGLISFLVLVAQLTLYGLEISSVRVNHLWPRSLAGPPYTDADREVLRLLARQELRRDGQRIDVTFDNELHVADDVDALARGIG
jgi:YihY family inner membrane protein